jgi:hypothetical protein
MGRLENIIARNRRQGRPREKLMTSLVLGAIVLFLIVLAVCTDLGVPPGPARVDPGSAATGSGSAAAPVPHRNHRVDGVLLRAPAQR